MVSMGRIVTFPALTIVETIHVNIQEPVFHARPASMEVNAVEAVHTIVTETHVEQKMVRVCYVNLASMGVSVGYLVQPTAKTTFVTKNMGPVLRVNQVSIKIIVILHAPPTVKTTAVTLIMEHVINANLDGQEQLAKKVSVIILPLYKLLFKCKLDGKV